MDLKRNKVYYLSAAGAYKWKEESRAGDRFELHLGRYDDFVHLIWHPQRQDGRGVPSGDGGGQQRCPIDACTVGSHVSLERFDAHRGKGRTYRHHQQNPESHHQVDFPGDGSQKLGGKSHIHEHDGQSLGAWQCRNAFGSSRHEGDAAAQSGKTTGHQLDGPVCGAQYRLHPAHPNNHRRHTGQIWSTVAYGHSAGGLGDESYRTGGRHIRGKAVAAEEIGAYRRKG